MLGLSNLAALLVALTLTGNAAATPTADSDTVFAVYPGWDMDNGQTSPTIFNGTEADCAKSCATTAGSKAYAYVPYSGAYVYGPSCYLKDAVDLSKFVKQPRDTNVGLPGPCGTYQPVGPTECYNVTVSY
ncbi:hypothetical protein DFH06DRAFT_752399 [Mycena polygramma]|nr:hypothetical protein DFH06DRAFT_752399 [Mycena polygramma]